MSGFYFSARGENFWVESLECLRTSGDSDEHPRWKKLSVSMQQWLGRERVDSHLTDAFKVFGVGLIFWEQGPNFVRRRRSFLNRHFPSGHLFTYLAFFGEPSIVQSDH